MTAQLTFLFTDIEASTRGWEHHPDDMSVALARHDEAIQQAVKEAGGKVFKHTGDGICAVFSTAPSALGAALAAQAVFQGDGWANEPLRVRMALHSGTAERRGGDYFGPALNRTARLLDTAHGQQVVVSLVTAELLRDDLPPGVDLLDLGEHRLADLARPERVFQVIQGNLAAAFPPLRSLGAHRHNLPVAPSSFIGREGELEAVSDLLRSSRLVTLSGVGGVGKTRLALQVAAGLLGAYPDGVFMVELAALADPSLVVLEIVRTLQLVEAAKTVEAALDRLCADLRSRRLLLLLDNCEHLLDSVATVGETLLRHCPDVVVLTTSREPLTIPGEMVWRVPTLGLPPSDAGFETLSTSDAVTLFCERAAAADASFRLTAQNAPAVARICRRLDGIPLALELAAARIRVLSPEQIADRLDDRFGLLSSGSRTASARQQTLQATMDWSYELLPQPEQLLLQRISVFAGSFDLEAVESVAADGEALREPEVLDLLAHLVDRSLVVVDGFGRAVRYRLLETVREYADAKLAASDSAEAVRRRHRDYFVSLTNQIFSVSLPNPSRHGPAAALPQQVDTPWADWVTRSKIEDDLRAALEWSLAQGESEAALLLVVPLGYYWTLAGRLGEGRARLESVLALNPASRSEAWAMAVNVLGFLLSIQGELDRSLALHEEALAVARERGNTYEAGVAQYYIGNRALHRGDTDRADAVLTAAYEDCRAVGSHAGMGWCEVSLGWVNLARGEPEEAAERFERAIELGRRDVNAPTAATRPGVAPPAAALEASPLLLGHALGSLAPLAALAGDEDRASTLAAQGVEMARLFGLAAFLLMTLTRATEVSILTRRWPSAEATLRESLGLLRDTGAQAFLADSLEMTALLRAVGGAHNSAARLFGAAERVRTIGGESADVRCVSAELERCRARLTDVPGFDRERERGKRLSPSEAVAFALEELEAGPAAGAGSSALPRLGSAGAVTPAVLRQQQRRWLVGCGGATFELPDMRGLQYLARLLAQPGREVHVLDLTGGPAEDAGPVLDERAKREYGRRVRELHDEIEEAESWNDPERVVRAQLELDVLTRQLAAAVGLGGRNRPSGSSAERARVSVRKAIAKAIAHIADHDADLALFLSTTVKTGAYCSYVPDPRLPVEWSL